MSLKDQRVARAHSQDIQPLPSHHLRSNGIDGYSVRNSPLSVMDSLQNIHTHHSQRRADSATSIASFSDYGLSYQSPSLEQAQGYSSPLDHRIESPQNSHISGRHGSCPEASVGHGSIASLKSHRQSTGSAGHTGNLFSNGSMDDSETATSPSSSRGQENQLVSRNVTDHAGNGDGNTQGETEKAPSWSELKTKAGKERKRLPLACIACRRKKIRCSGEKPACKHCLRSRIPCVYKVTTRKAAPRTDYMAMLDKRLKRMEERVIKIIPKEEAGKIANIARANVKPPSASQAPKSSGSKKRSADEAFFEELNEWTQSTSIYGTSQDRQPRKLDQNERQLLTEGAEHLPSEDLQEHLAEVFFDCLYGQSYHLLHKPSFMRRLRARTVPPVLILAVCAVAARFSTHPQVNTEPAFLRGESWAKPARDIALRRYDEPNITILTVYLILGLHEFGTCQGGRSWMLGGMAVRMAYALQLHRELDHDPLGRNQEKPSELSFTDREIRRRTMWACFLMDRFNSSGTERPMFANEENIEVQLPINESNFQMEISGPTEGLDGSVPNPVVPDVGQVSNPKENMGVAAYSIRVIALWGQLIKYFNLGGQAKDPHPIWHEDSQFTELKKQVNDFKSSLPSFLVYTMDNLQNHGAEKLGNQFLFLHICLNQVILFMHKFAIPAAPGGRIPKEMPKEFVAKAAPIAFEAAGQISNLLNESSEHLLTAPFTGYCAFLSSTVHVWAIFSKNPQFEDSSKQNLAYNVKYLSRMKKHWGMFHYMVENLKEIYRQYADAALRGPNASGSSLQDTSIFQYGDWYTKYPHGVSSTDYQDPDTDDKEEAGVDAVLSQKTDLQSVEAFFSNLLPTKQSRENARHARSQRKKDISHEAHSQLLQSLKADSQLQQHSQLMSQSPPMLTIPPQQQQQQAFDTSPYSQQDHLYTPSHTTPFPFNFNTPNLMAMAQHTPFLGDLDRQLVYGAYASNDSDPASSLLNNIAESSQGHPQNASAWDQALEYSHSIASQSGQGYADLGSTSAWLMPFNLNPPLPLDVGSDTDYTGLGGYGDSEQAGSSGV